MLAITPLWSQSDIAMCATILTSPFAIAGVWSATFQEEPRACNPVRPSTSIECSKQADAQGLKGKPRKVFRAKCKRDLLKKKT